jgi:hypothetical protein
LNWNNAALNPWVIGIGSSLTAGCIGWLLRRWIVSLWRQLFCRSTKTERGGIEEVYRNTVRQNASPVMTQNFQPTINVPIAIHPPVGAATKDGLGERGMLETESETVREVLRELWNRIAALKNAFWVIPKAGGIGVIAGRPPNALEKSADFVKSYDEAARFLEQEIPFIPKAIADEAAALLKVAFDEALRATRCPDPFNANVNTLLSEKFFEQRSANIRDFVAGAEKLGNTIRAFRERKN